MDSNRKWYQKRHWCLYFVLFVIISCFFCHILAINKRNITELSNLKEDLEVLSVNSLFYLLLFTPNLLYCRLPLKIK